MNKTADIESGVANMARTVRIGRALRDLAEAEGVVIVATAIVIENEAQAGTYDFGTHIVGLEQETEMNPIVFATTLGCGFGEHARNIVASVAAVSPELVGVTSLSVGMGYVRGRAGQAGGIDLHKERDADRAEASGGETS